MDANTTQLVTTVKDTIQWMDWITVVFSFGAMFVSGINWWNDKKQKQLELEKIKIYFFIEETKQKYLLDLDIARKDIARAEIQGVLSAFQKIPSQRYSISYLSDIKFLDDIYKIQNNKENRLHIKITQKEFDGWEKMENNKKIYHNGFDTSKMKECK